MSDACVIATGAVSALGCGVAAYDVASVGEAARSAIKHDAILANAGFLRPRLARAPSALATTEWADRAGALLAESLRQVIAELDRRLPEWRSMRIGVCIGTSSGGMLSAERYFTARAKKETLTEQDVARATYFAPYVDALRASGLDVRGSAHPGHTVPVKHRQIVAACASSTIAIGTGLRWLDRGACDLVLAGGYDAIGLFVAAGFEAIRATSEGMPRPFREGRDGMILGEGAGMVAMVREDAAREPLFRVMGYGASGDAVHITAPDRSGAGLVRAGTRALSDARCVPESIALVSAHATATPYNDAAEAKAIHTLSCGDPVVHPFKAQIGHTLGAAGVLELLAAAHAMARGVLPAAYGEGSIDPEARVRLLERAEEGTSKCVLKLSAAFGGITAALVAGRARSGRSATHQRRVVLAGWARVHAADRADMTRVLAEQTGMVLDRLARIDDLGLLTLAAAAKLKSALGSEALVAGTGVVAGHALATLDTNERFFARLLAKGPRWVDPRLFPATSPNAGAGHCAIAFGLTGPNFAVNGGLGGGMEALVAAGELVAAGDAPRVLLVAADDGGPASREWVARVCPGRTYEPGAVAALLVAAEAGANEPAATAGPQVDLDLHIEHEAGPIGHVALVDWLVRSWPMGERKAEN